jgi:hypothetical protein
LNTKHIPSISERSKPLLCLTCLFMLMTTGACGRPDPTSSPPTPAAPTISVATTPTEEPMAGGKLPDLTETALAPTMVILTPAPSPTSFSPPTPVLPLDQTLREFPRDALLYLVDHRFLMLVDQTGTHQLWLNGAPCVTSFPWGVWSASGQFLVMVCSTELGNGQTYPIRQAILFDMRSGAVTRLASGALLSANWSPVGNRLLMNVQEAIVEGVSNGERLTAATVLIDNEAGTVTRLPITAGWAWMGDYSLDGGPTLPLAVPRGEAGAAINWSPDGSRFALKRLESEGGGLYVLNADGRNPQRIEAIEATPAYVGIKDLVGWSADGRWLEVVRLARARGPQTNPDPQRIWVSPDTGEIRTDDPVPTAFGWWSPDGQWYLSYANKSSRNLALFRADGTLIREVATEWDNTATNPLWTPDSKRFIIVKSTLQTTAVVINDLTGHEQLIRAIPLDVNRIGFVDLDATYDREHLALGFCSSSPPSCQITIMTQSGETQAMIPDAGSTLQIIGWQP